MRIVIHGQQAFGRAVLERLIEREEDIVAVCTAPDKEGRPLDPLKELALEHGLAVHQPESWKTPEALTLMQSFDADICIMAYVLLLVPQPVLDAPRLGSFQYHPSLLPLHRGPSSINWPIAMGATRTGLSIFWPNEGLDEGPVLMQKECEIGPDETLGDIYFNKLYPMGVDAMIESLDLVKAGTAPKQVQNLDEGSYESWFGKAQAEIDWSKSAAEVYNTIRAANPQPGAWTSANGATVQIYDSQYIESVSGDAGVVAEVNDDGILVAAGDGDGVLISRVRPAGEGKISAAEFAASGGIKVGDQLG
ncbi:MAG: methionyl-tRNA formyltransferase [Gammaproteobacteria bacterium]|nr:MAG: methionyl-tRNA formyltransferase [Gammaproteobacteria bacterium]